MKDDNRNVYVAIALSILVIIGWQFFYGYPQMQKQRQAQGAAATQNGQPSTPVTRADAAADNALARQPQASPPNGAASQPAAGMAPVEIMKTRAEAVAANPHVVIDTPAIAGSIDLKGGRIDDVSLKDYHETTDKASPIIDLFSPSNGPHPYYAETGFVAGAGDKVALPGASTVWTADGDRLTPGKPVTLSWDNGQGLVFRREVSVDDQYMFTVKDSVTNSGAAPVTLLPYALISRHGTPVTSNYSVLHEGLIGQVGDNREADITYAAMDKETGNTRTLEGTGGWLGVTDKYWAGVVAPPQDVPYKGTFSSYAENGNRDYQTDALLPARTVAPGASTDVTTHVFAGAKVTAVLNKYEQEYGIEKFGNLIDWGWFYFITKPLFQVIDWFYKLTGNFGVAILIVTVLIKGLFFPLANKSYASMARMKMLQPQLAALKERFPDDKQKQQEATMKLYREQKVNPVAGCLPMVIQIPVFFALYKVIFITIEMRHAPFFGWIHDLSAPDPVHVLTLGGLLPIAGFLPNFLLIGIWPVIMGFSMFLQMKMNPEPPDPVQKQMFSYMPLVFMFMLGTFPSGLVIYWTWNNTLTVIQQYLIAKKQGAKVELWDNLAGTFRRTRKA
jgi:YidC/Oxa1 family membrane protein insertase